MNVKQADIISEVLKELKRAKKKYPSWPQHMAARAGIVCEEAGELMRACLQWKYEKGSTKEERVDQIKNMKKEAIQTAAMTIRFLEQL